MTATRQAAASQTSGAQGKSALRGGGSTVAGTGTAVRAALSRWQFWIVLLILGALAAVAVQLTSDRDAELFGLQNTDLDGYAALAQVLDREGVDIHPARTAEQARQLMEQHPQASVVVLSQGFLPPEDLSAQLRDAEGSTVWISANSFLLEEMLGLEEIWAAQPIPLGAAGTPETLNTGPRCEFSPALSAQSLQAPGGTLSAAQGCFPVWEDSGEGDYALVDTDHGVAFAAPEAFTNRHVTSAGNAALALGLLSPDTDGAVDIEQGSAGQDSAGQGATRQGSDLIWYTPSAAETLDTPQWASPWQFLPPWFWPLVAWLLICTAVAAVAFGRRYGPVITEPLPVEVPASEAAEGRARMYSQSGAAGSAAAVLRNGQLLKLARLLRLGHRPTAATVSEAAARHTGRPVTEVSALLEHPTATGHRQLVSYAQALAALESDVRITLGLTAQPSDASTSANQPIPMKENNEQR